MTSPLAPLGRSNFSQSIFLIWSTVLKLHVLVKNKKKNRKMIKMDGDGGGDLDDGGYRRLVHNIVIEFYYFLKPIIGNV